MAKKLIDLTQGKLFRLKLLQPKAHTQTHNKNLRVEEIEWRLKKSLWIMSKYSEKRKRILFISNSLAIDTQIESMIRKTRHTLLSQYVWTDRIMTKRNEKTGLLLSRPELKYDLIVILDADMKNTNLKVKYVKPCPVVHLNDELNIFDTEFHYKIPGDFFFPENQLMKYNFFIVLLRKIIKKHSKRKYT